MVHVLGLAHRYADRTVLKIDALWMDRGERWLIAGPSGSGKTTLLTILAGLLRPTQGDVGVAGQLLCAMSEGAIDTWRGRTIGYVPQKLHLLPSLNVMDNLVLAQFLAGRREDRVEAQALLMAVSMDKLASRYPYQLSQGQAQRVAVARAVINSPALLLADEPTASLDEEQALRALTLLIERAQALGATLAVASHDRRIRPHFEHILELPGSGSE
jgi:ABC-type lipoprotein export system ATPase subunit